MKTIIAFNSQKSALIGGLINFAFLLWVIYIFFQAYSEGYETKVYLILGALIVFFSLLILVFVRRYFDKKVQLMIGGDGLYAPGLGAETITWQDVKQIFVNTVGEQDFLSVVLHDYGKYMQDNSGGSVLWPSYNHASKCESLDIDLTNIEIETGAVEKIILDLIKSDHIDIS